MLKIKHRMLHAHMAAAEVYGQTSYALRLKVGCVVVNPETDQPVSIGWNGTPPGEPNVCEEEVDGVLVSLPNVVHAEQNALLRLDVCGIQEHGLYMFVSHSPCPACVDRIINDGRITKVFYSNEYRIKDGLVKLLKARIQLYRLENNKTFELKLNVNAQVESIIEREITA